MVCGLTSCCPTRLCLPQGAVSAVGLVQAGGLVLAVAMGILVGQSGTNHTEGRAGEGETNASRLQKEEKERDVRLEKESVSALLRDQPLAVRISWEGLSGFLLCLQL